MAHNYFSNQIGRLYQDSIVHQLLGRFRFFGRDPFDDKVRPLSTMPVAMFYYNLRAISLALGFSFLILLALLAVTSTANSRVFITIYLLSGFVLIEALIALALHGAFRTQLREWSIAPMRDRVPPLMDLFFLLDVVLVLVLVLVGRLFALNLDAFSFLLLANVITYATSFGSGGLVRRGPIVAIASSLVVITLLLFSSWSIRVADPRWFYVTLNAGPLLFMAVVTVVSVSMVSWLRGIENNLNLRRLQLLALYEAKFSDVYTDASHKEKRIPEVLYSERHLWDRCTEILKHLCSFGEPFWYRSACLWLVEDHQDRGRLFLPGPDFNFNEATSYRDGLANLTGSLDPNQLILLPSVKHSADSRQINEMAILPNVDAPAAFVPLKKDGVLFAVLALYGKEAGPNVLAREEAFLSALGSILSNSMQQWETRNRALVYREMDLLFECRSLDEIFPRAAIILKRHIQAASCLIIFRPDPKERRMEVRAGDGFNPSIVERNFYEVGSGQTGKCAELGQPIKFDSVDSHLEEFASDRLNELEKAIGEKVISWLSVPIGSKENNFGIIKFLNSRSPRAWFTDRDQALAMGLALRLRVIIERFLYVKEIEEANLEAQRAVKTAHAHREQAEQAARNRQEDLMVITHQLQGPLVSINAGINYLQHEVRRDSPRFAELDRINALVEDALALCHGTFMSFALAAGREMSRHADEIDAPAELKMLCERLRKTNARSDLEFVFKQEVGFPSLRMDRSVFTGVFYSLIHNAMKYAERTSRVTLECGFERATGKAVLKVKSYGFPIHPSEREKIFERYQRGSIVTKTGRYHTGVGLGLWVARQLMRASGGDLTVELSSSHPELSVFIVEITEGVSRHAN